jgi:dihydroxy-acid dehydratase
MFTANSMNCLCEAIGLALPGNGTILATTCGAASSGAKRPGASWRWPWPAGPRPRDIVTPRRHRQRLRARHGHGRQLQHRAAHPGLAHEAGVAYDLDRINALSPKCPNVCKVSPASEVPHEDVMPPAA